MDENAEGQLTPKQNRFMAKLHTSLKPSTNIVLIFLWGLLAALITLSSLPISLAFAFMGGTLGVICGIMQNHAIEEARESISNAESLIGIRRILKSTKWGSRYIVLLWTSKALFLASVLLAARGNRLGEYLAAIFSLMFFREIVTFRATISLSEFAKSRQDESVR